MNFRKTLYLDYQATTPVDERVFAKMAPYFVEVFGNPHSTDHCLGWEAAQAIEHAVIDIAQLIGADPDEIIFTSGATESNNLALLGLGRRFVAGKRRRILVSAIEHKSVLEVCRILSIQHGYRVEQVAVDSQGRILIAELENALNDDVLLVSIMAVNNEIGTIQDIQRLSQAIRKSGAFFHCDAAQAPTAMDLRFIAQHLDLMSLSAHKMYGPKGIGILFAQRRLQNQLEPMIYGGDQQLGLRSGTLPVPLCVGMGEAAKILSGDEAEHERLLLSTRRDRFVRKLQALSWQMTLNGPQCSNRHPCNANIRIKGISAQDALGALQPRLAASTGAACTSGIAEPSHVLKAIGLAGEEIDSSIRFSIGRGVSDADLERAVGYIEEMLARLIPAP